MLTTKPILAVDFDGTLVVDRFPEIGHPFKAVFDYVKTQQSAGTHVILWTCRHGKSLEEAVDFCKRFGLEFDAVNENIPAIKAMFNNDTRKVYADKYLDDKNMLLSGLWL